MFTSLQGMRVRVSGLSGRWSPKTGILLLLLLLTLSLGPLLEYSPLRELISLDNLQQWRGRWAESPLAWLVYAIAGTLAASLGFPLTLLIIAAGVIFGVLKGVLLAFVIALLSAALGYVLGNWHGRELVERHFSQYYAPLRTRLEAHAFLAVLAMRFVVPFAAANLIAGTFRLPWSWYMSATALGVSPWILALVLVSANLHESYALGWRLSLIGLVLLALGALARYIQIRVKQYRGS